MAAGNRPPHEIRRPGQVAGVPGQPLVKITLGAHVQGQPTGIRPVQERGRGDDLIPHVLHLLGMAAPFREVIHAKDRDLADRGVR